MRRIERLAAAQLCLAALSFCYAQVLSPPEILDPEIRELQQKHMAELKSVAVAIASHHFPYHFYFSRKLDLSEEQQRASDQRSIQFARFQNQIVLQITGNYFAAYSGELMKKEDRARRTIEDVMLPILNVVAPALQQEKEIQSFALEISHHVRKKTLGVMTERAENVVLAIPRDEAVRLASSSTPSAQQAALQEATIFLDAQPIDPWPHRATQAAASAPLLAAPAVVAAAPAQPPGQPPPSPVNASPRATPVAAAAPPPVPPTVEAHPAPPPSSPADASPEELKKLQFTWQETLNRIVRDLDSSARFIGYAPPTFIPFHKGVYLQLSISTPLPAAVAGSRYRLAALAFDDHIARLIRPLLAYFKEDLKFDGIDFSTTIRLEGAADASSAFAVEYIFGMPALRCYEQYDCTGQRLINSGFVLINGERVGLDLQNAETAVQR